MDESDAPEVRDFLDAVEADYQLVLVSATITSGVRKFARGAMELVAGSDVAVAAPSSVAHAAIACAEAAWVDVAGDLVATTGAALTLVFARSIADCRNAADALDRRLPRALFDVLQLHELEYVVNRQQLYVDNDLEHHVNEL